MRLRGGILKKRNSMLFLCGFFLAIILFVGFFFIKKGAKLLSDNTTSPIKSIPFVSTPTSTPISIPAFYEIPKHLHVFQSFNNCGPATLSMALSYLGVEKSQEELGQILRPYQVAGGDNDDKSVTLDEVAKQAETYGFTSYLRPNGDIEKLKQLIANDIPVVARTFLHTNEDIGHYRIIRGYDDNTKEIIQDDSLQGADLRYSYNEFLKLWQPFNYEYLVIVPEGKKQLVESILKEDVDSNKAWQNALIRIDQEQKQDPENVHLIFALSRIYYYLRDYKKSVEVFNQVENRLSFRTLWYQIEPLLAIYETGDYARVMQKSEQVLNNQNRAYSELYILRGKIYEKQGNTELAKQEYNKAVLYNTGLAGRTPTL